MGKVFLTCRGTVRRVKSSNTRILGVLALLGTSLIAVPSFAQTAEEKAGARAAANAGADAFDAGDFEKSLDMFQRAESIIHSPIHEIYIGRSLVQLSRLVEAREVFLKVQRDNSTADGNERALDDATSELAKLEPRVPRVALSLVGGNSDGVRITVDGKEFRAVLLGIEQPFDPGEHTIEVTGQGRKLTTTARVEEGAHDSIALDLSKGEPYVDPDATPAVAEENVPATTGNQESVGTDDVKGKDGMRIGSYVALGLGAGGLALGTVFAFQAKSNAGKSNDICDAADAREGTTNCAGRTTDEQTQVEKYDDKFKSARTVSIIGFAAGGALVATGVTLLILSNSKGEKEKVASVKVRPILAHNYWGISGTF